MTKVLIETTGWIGDILFALSLPEKLKKERSEISRLDFLIDKPQPYLLLKNNNYIDNVYLNNLTNSITYDFHYKMPVIEDKSIAPTIQYQKYCGIKNLSSEFQVEVEDLDISVPKNTIAIQGDWDTRIWNITDEEAKLKIFDQTGVYSYYKTLRPIDFNKFIAKIIKQLPSYNFIIINPWNRTRSFSNDPRGYNSSPHDYRNNAATIKKCVALLGAEGGLTNLSAGLGVKTIYTTCHMHRMFGEQGVISQCKDIQLGPEKLFPGKGHKAISPFATQEEAIQTIIENL